MEAQYRRAGNAVGWLAAAASEGDSGRGSVRIPGPKFFC